jgi:hypothetical protein
MHTAHFQMLHTAAFVKRLVSIGFVWIEPIATVPVVEPRSF